MEELLAPYPGPGLRPDELVRFYGYLLSHAGIEHKIMEGTVSFGNRKAHEHFWVQFPGTDLVLDSYLRVYFWEEASMPMGIFSLKQYDKLKYEGKESRLDASAPWFKVLEEEFRKKLNLTLRGAL